MWTWDKLVTALAGVLVALPSTLALVPDLELSPAANAAMLVLALIGAVLLKQQPPSGSGALSPEGVKQEPDENGLSDEDVERIAQARERIRRAEIARIKAAGQSGG